MKIRKVIGLIVILAGTAAAIDLIGSMSPKCRDWVVARFTDASQNNTPPPSFPRKREPSSGGVDDEGSLGSRFRGNDGGGISSREPSPSQETLRGPERDGDILPSNTNTPEWNTYHGGNALLGYADGPLPDTLALLWRFKAGAAVRQTPVVYRDRIFFPNARGEVIAVDLAGERLWSKELFAGEQVNGEPVREKIEAPVACFAGRVFAGSADGALYSLDAASGEQQWRSKLDGPILGSPNYIEVEGKGRVYVLQQSDAMLCCFDAESGSELWRSKPIDRCDSSPAVSSSAVVFGSCAAALHVFSSATGAHERDIALDDDSQVAGGVALDGNIVVSGSRGGRVFQADVTTGNVLWANAESTAEVFSTPAITGEWVVASSNDGIVYGLDRKTGDTRWRFDTDGGMPTSAIIVGDKVAVCADGTLYLLRLSDGTKVWSFEVSDEITSPAAAGRMILVGSEDGTVAAFGPQIEETVSP
jgi:outer membrane protein assembly factor BamB